MPKYVTIGYGDQAGYEKTPEDLRSAAHAQDKKLQDEGAVMGFAGTPVQVRNTCGAEVTTETGAFMSSRLPIAGFAIIEAENISQAINGVAHALCDSLRCRRSMATGEHALRKRVAIRVQPGEQTTLDTAFDGYRQAGCSKATRSNPFSTDDFRPMRVSRARVSRRVRRRLCTHQIANTEKRIHRY